METIPVSFIDELIDVSFKVPTIYKKTPVCPEAFVWRGERYEVVELLEERRDFTRKGKMSRNMTPGHAAQASVRGSWGVGKFNFRVKVQTGQIFDIYYDRAPQDAGQREGEWFLKGERKMKVNSK